MEARAAHVMEAFAWSYLQSANGSFEYRTASERWPEGRVVQCRLSVDEDSSSATACLHRDPVARFILPNDELQTRIPAARFPRFADT
jgi:hypothetical protein